MEYGRRPEDIFREQGQQAQVERYGGIGRTSYRSNLDRFFDLISVGQYAVQGAIHGVIDKDQTIGEGVWEGIKSANPFGQDYQQGEYSFGENLGALGWQPKSTVGKVAKGVVGFAGDVLLDPLTYATLGASAVVKGTGTKVATGIGKKAGQETVERFTKDMAKSALQKTGKEVTQESVEDLMKRVNKLRGVEEGGKGIGIFGKELVGADTLRAFGDRTIAPYYNALTTKARKSKLFSTKGDLITLAKDDPEALVKTFDFIEKANEAGYDYTKRLEGLKEQFKEFDGLDEDIQKQITSILEDKSLWDKVVETKPLGKTKEGEEAFGKMEAFIKKYGEEHPEMKKLMGELEPKFKPNETAYWRSQGGDIPVKILGEADYQGQKFYKTYIDVPGYKGVNYVPESAMKTTDEVASEIEKATVRDKVTQIKTDMKQGKRKPIDLSTKTMSKEEFMKQYMKDQAKKTPKVKVRNLFGSDFTDLKLTPIATKSEWDAMETLAQKQSFFENIIKADPILSTQVFDDLIATKSLDKLKSEKVLNRIMNNYFDGNLDAIVKEKHKLHKAYNVAQKTLNTKYGDFKNLSRAQKRQYWSDMYDYLNNPAKLARDYDVTLQRGAGRDLTDIGEQFAQQEARLSEMASKDVQRPGYANMEQIKEDMAIQDVIGKTNKYDATLPKADHTQAVYDDDLLKEQQRLIDEAMQTSRKDIKPELEKQDYLTAEERKAIEELEPPVKYDIEKAMQDIPKDIDESLRGKANKDALVARKLSEYRNALSNEAEFETYMRTIWGDEKVDDILKKHSSETLVIDKLNLHNDDVVKVAKDIRDTFKDVKQIEQDFNLLDKSIQEGYVAHILTPEAKGIIDGMSEKELVDLGITKTGNNFSIGRKYRVGTELPNGKILEKGTIEEINEYMKDVMGGNDLFADKISDIYLARMQKHYKLMYEEGFLQDMTKKFGTPYRIGDALKANHELIYSTDEVNKLIRGKSKLTRETILNRLGLNEEEFSKLGKSFQRIDEETAKTIGKEGYVKIHQIPTVLADKAETLSKVQMAGDVNFLLKQYDKFLSTWKKLVTVYRPAFYVNNIKGNAFNNYLNVGSKALSPRLNKYALDIAKGLDGKIKLNNKVYDYETLRRMAGKHGVTNKGWFENIKRKGLEDEGLIGKAKETKKLRRSALYELGNLSENQAKFVNFMANIDNGKSFREAGENANKYLFDYSDLTKFESEKMTRVFPFYTWMKKNSLLQLEEMAKNPEKYLPVKKAIDEIENMSGNDRVDKSKMPEWAQDWVQLPWTVRNELGHKEVVMWSPSLPYMDINKLPYLFNPMKGIKKTLSQVSPLIKVPAELATNQNLYFDGKIDRGQKVLDPTGNVAISPRLSYLLNQIPQVGAVQKATSPGSPMQKFLGILNETTGTSFKTVSPRR